jgi:carbon monoxide dehydrogenase subunit G
MEMTGEYRIPATRETVWEALNDPEILKICIPGCEELIKESETEMTAKVKTRVGPVSARFAGKVTLSEINPPESYKISGEGQGGVAGFAKGGAVVKLAEDGDGTILTYTATAQVGGKLAQIGSRLIDATAKKMADQFFSNFAEEVGAAAVEAPAEAVPAEQAAGGISPMIWIGGLIGVVVILLLIFS